MAKTIHDSIIDADWRLRNLYKIKNRAKETSPFSPNMAQIEIGNTIKNLQAQGKPIRLIVLKPRQVGVTTYFCLRNFDMAYWHYNQFVAVVAHLRDKADEIFREIVKFSYDTLPEVLRFKAYNDSVRQLAWRKTQSQIQVFSEVHGVTPSRLHLTEVARIKNAKEIITESLPGVPPNGWAIQESTANGRNNYFYDSWQESYDNPRGRWTPIFIKWWLHDEYRLPIDKEFNLTEKEQSLFNAYVNQGLTLENLAWRRAIISELGGHRVDIETGLSGSLAFQQNYPMSPEEAFILPHGSMFNITALHKQSLDAPAPISTQQIGPGTLKVWEELQDDCLYLISVDPSYGEAGSYSAATVLRRIDRAVVATLHGKFLQPDLAKHLYKLGKFYNNALIAIERNTGHPLINELVNHMGYGHVYYHTEYDEKRRSVRRPGFPTNAITRTQILSALEDAIETNAVFIRDKGYINECLNFGNKNGKWQAMSGNDDRVMSLAIGIFLCNQSNRYLEPPKINLERSVV